VSLGRVSVLGTTAKGIVVLVGMKACPLPKSAIHASSEIRGDEPRGTAGVLVMKRWLAKKRGLST